VRPYLAGTGLPAQAFASQQGGVILADQVITPAHTLRPGWVHVTGAVVTAVGEGQPPHPPTVRLPTGSTVIPGLVDTHVHGGGGHAMTEADEREVTAAATFHLGDGTTSTLVSLVTAPTGQLHDSLALVADLVDRGPGAHGRVLGSHLEGPYLSPVRRGAHPLEYLENPTRSTMRAFLETSRGTVRMVTFAPELPGALGDDGLVRQLTQEGVTAAVGHTDASFEVTVRSLAEGATCATHLFNGMRPMGHRDPGPVAALLGDDRVRCELINDGIHVDPAVAVLAARLLSAGRLVLITDAVAATGAPDGRYILGQTPIVRHEGQIRTADGTSLGGSDLTLAAALRRAVSVLGLNLADAVAAATLVPAHAVGCGDTVGSLAPGRPADLVVLDAELNVQAVMLAGSWIVTPPLTPADPRSRETSAVVEVSA